MVSDSKEPQPGISQDENATPEEIAGAIESLTAVELVKMERFARYRIRGLGRKAQGRDHEDLIKEALTATLAGTRRWKKEKVSFMAHLVGVMRSLSSHWAEGFSQDEAYLEAELIPDAQGHTLLWEQVSPDPSVERVLSARQELCRIESQFAGDPTVPLILDGFRQGMNGPEIQLANGLSKNDYESALRRLRRWVATSEPEGVMP